MKRYFQSGLALALVAFGCCGAHGAETNDAAAAKPADKRSGKPTDLFADSVIARGKGVEISRSAFDEAIIGIKASSTSRGQVIPPDRMEILEQQVLERLIQIQLLLTKATDADRAKGKEISEKRYDVVRKRAGGDEAFARQLKLVDMSPEDLKAKLLEEAIAEAVLERELKINISTEDAKKYYDEHTAQFEEPEMVRASHVLISTRDSKGTELDADKKAAKKKIAEDVLKRARAGEDFAKLAKEYSDDPGSKDKGGEYTFPRGQMVPEFEKAAFSLNTNQVSDIVTTQFGYHIIKLSEKIPAHKLDFAKVEPDIKEGLKQMQMQKQMPDYLAKLKKDAKVEILDDRLKELDARVSAQLAAVAATNSSPISLSPPASKGSTNK